MWHVQIFSEVEHEAKDLLSVTPTQEIFMFECLAETLLVIKILKLDEELPVIIQNFSST